MKNTGAELNLSRDGRSTLLAATGQAPEISHRFLSSVLRSAHLPPIISSHLSLATLLISDLYLIASTWKQFSKESCAQSWSSTSIGQATPLSSSSSRESLPPPSRTSLLNHHHHGSCTCCQPPAHLSLLLTHFLQKVCPGCKSKNLQTDYSAGNVV